MAYHITKMYDMLDRIVFDYYGDTENGIVEYIIEQNPGIEKHGLLLPRGIRVELPDRPSATKPGTPVITQIRLFD